MVITDGVDTSSRLTPAEVSGKAAAIDVPVYVIAVVLSIDDPGSDRATPQGARKAPATVGTIEDLARWTGGSLYYSSTSASASKAARGVVDELRQLYLIAFEPGRGCRLASAGNSSEGQGHGGSGARRLRRWRAGPVNW